MKEVYNTVLNAQNNCLKNLHAGISCKEGDELTRSVIRDAGYGEYFTHSTGHGVGVEILEFPNRSRITDGNLCAGNVVTVEPAIYIAGKFAVRIEDMAYITPDGCRNLTNAPKELIIL